ncbi:uncharacterized protein B0I36DRAFT_388525 [Microdochium trichocladiopsis]|uniref:Uncharacterized protein n=1 Tax=Microdochium trichocladiopsis TaxID=1682393 RepID=A0A9P9BJN9_9PEZI|nr:uncharacterized protein B0I36DRAFT_388525 [Microdochium trichocladiopsis]KAH7018285.1 hypothetical protein B0I36DRAFT_388525 [Microdochium trichocladiopsis]
MFGTLTSLVQSATVGPPPKDVPPPTQIVLPEYHPRLDDNDTNASPPHIAADSLVPFLQTLYRPPQLDESYFKALGVHVHDNVSTEDIIPDPALLPQATGWEDMTPEHAQDVNKDFQRPLCNGNKSPDARIYTDRRKELSADNQAAFRTLRRIKPEPGKQAVRLGGSYEFFKQMDLMAGFWDDTSLPAQKSSEDDVSKQLAREDNDDHSPPGATPILHPIDGSLDQAAHALVAATTEPVRPHQQDDGKDDKHRVEGPEQVVFRTGVGSQMPASYRHDMVSAFIKLVAYDFGCNIAPSRVEPRLYLRAPTSAEANQPSTVPMTVPLSSPDEIKPKIHGKLVKEPKCSHLPSGCTFLFRMPTTREAARAGIVEGPVAAVSIRNATSFTPTSSTTSPLDSRASSQPAKDEGSLDARLDLGREIIAALVTAQLRDREGRTEQRIGEGKWWASEKRWGGGQGGPIGREIDNNTEISSTHQVGDEPDKMSPPSSSSPSTKSPPQARTHLQRITPSNKRPRKTLSIYDNYRMVRKPASNWDSKARYQAIGKQPGADYDDIFLFSSLFHHFSVVRVRVPKVLLRIFEGDVTSAAVAAAAGETALPTATAAGGARPWGKLEVWRTQWFDLFIVKDRLEAMRLLWGVMMWLMRETANEESVGSGTGRGQEHTAPDVVTKDS